MFKLKETKFNDSLLRIILFFIATSYLLGGFNLLIDTFGENINSNWWWLIPLIISHVIISMYVIIDHIFKDRRYYIVDSFNEFAIMLKKRKNSLKVIGEFDNNINMIKQEYELLVKDSDMNPEEKEKALNNFNVITDDLKENFINYKHSYGSY